MTTVLQCQFCGAEFIKNTGDKRIKYCSDKCRQGACNKRYHTSNTEKIKDYNKSRYGVKNAARRERYKNDLAHREKIKENSKNYNHRKPDTKRNNRLLNTFGITLDDYNKILTFQDYKCAICESTNSGDKQAKNFYVDHDHETGIVRGLLCSQCNLALGKFKDKPAILRRAADYVMLGGVAWKNG